jgi:thioesterase domain-containing protein
MRLIPSTVGIRGDHDQIPPTAAIVPEPKKVKPPRTHWDMLLERRSVEELDELLKERLDVIKTRRRGS